MRRIVLAIVVLYLLSAMPAIAGIEVVSGELYGTWLSKTTYIITGESWIPQGQSLRIPEGVQVMFETESPLMVFGLLNAQGTVTEPIIITATAGWGGFIFAPGGTFYDTLRYVFIAQRGAVPDSVIRSKDRNLLIEHCRFTARYSCLKVEEGRLRVDYGHFTCKERGARTIQVQELDDYDGYGSTIPGYRWLSYLDNSIAMVDVPEPEIPILPEDPTFSCALAVETCPFIDVRNSMFSAQAPGYVYGVYYGDATGQIPFDEIAYCVITAHSYDVQARGIWNIDDGDVHVTRCTIDVSGGAERFAPVAIMVSNSATAVVNSCILQVSKGMQYCSVLGNGDINVSHTDLFTSSPSLIIDPDREVQPQKGELLSVNYGDSIYYCDPLFVYGSEWGHWTDLASVNAYYSLQPSSPCIDRGDMLLGPDPDNTRPDVGRFYFPHSSSSVDLIPVVAGSIAMLPAYPNPFNASISIPLVLKHSSDVHLTVFDVLGRSVAELASEQMHQGNHTVSFDARGLPSGMYVVALFANNQNLGTQKVLLVR